MEMKFADELFAPIKRRFKKDKIPTHYKDECWSIDLIDRSLLSKYNNNNKFIFTIIDNFTKYAWGIPLKNKSGEVVASAFKTHIISSKRVPDKIWCDRGKEFYNKHFKAVLKENNIHMYSTHSDLKAVFVKRFNRALLELLTKQMFLNNDANWVKVLPSVLSKYNNRIHSTIKMTPTQASSDKSKLIYTEELNDKKPKLNVNDFVRIETRKKKFEKGFHQNWGAELFQVDEVINANPYVYRIRDENNEVIEGRYHAPNLLKSEFDYKTNKQLCDKLNIRF